jgi:hypothetical protein
MNNDSTSKPRVSPRRASRRQSLPRGGGRHARTDQRFARRLLSLLRDPVAVLSKALIRELKAPSMERLRQSLPAQAKVVFRLAAHSVIAFRDLIVLLQWRAAISNLPLSAATRAYVRAMRRHGVKVSRTSLYQRHDEFSRHGLIALVPRWGGGRRRRIPAPDRALLEDLYCGRNVCRNYGFIHRGLGLPGRAVSDSSVRRLLKEFSEQTTPNVRQRVTDRLRAREEGGHV